MATPAPATAGELLRVEPLELRFPCMPATPLSPALFFSSWFGGKKTVFFPLLSVGADRLVPDLTGVSREQSS